MVASLLADATMHGFLVKLVQTALQTVFQCHMVVGGKTQAGTHHIDDCLTLCEQCVNNRGAVWHERSLQHV